MAPPPPAPTPSSIATPQAQPTQSSIADKAPRPPPMRTSYRYETLTSDKLQQWAGQGRADIITYGQLTRDDGDTTRLSALFQEFLRSVIDGRIDAGDAGKCVKDIILAGAQDGQDSRSHLLHTLLLDSLAIILEGGLEQYAGLLKDFLISSEISPALVRQVLDAPLLEQLGLIRSNFARIGVRQATNLLYRQANYNLLREETEGYSKLISEVFTVCNSQPGPEPAAAQQTFEKIKALIGTFDLDVGRVLDVTLDVAAAVLIKQYQFIVKLFRVSSWWPRPAFKSSSPFLGGLPVWATPGYSSWTTSEEDEIVVREKRLARDLLFWDRVREVHLGAFFELGGRQVTDSDYEQWKLATINDSEDVVADFQRKWVEETKTLPPSGNRVAAQLLGFKLRYYSLEVRDKDDVLPANLLYLAALLIKIGFLSLTDLYPHLWPSDEDMEEVREKAMAELEAAEMSARGGAANALLAAGVLPQGEDDNPNSHAAGRPAARQTATETKPAASAETEKKSDLTEPLEQKVRLLEQLLNLGALPEALFFLGRFPWILGACPKILESFHRVLHVSLEKVFQDTLPFTTSDITIPPRKNMADHDQSGMPKGVVRLNPTLRKRFFRWPGPDVYDNKTNAAQDFRHYWEEWSDNIPRCQTVDDVFTLCNTLINVSGVLIGKDEALLSKLAKIGTWSLDTDSSDNNKERWLVLLKRLLVPALSHTNANVAVVNAIWDLLKRFPLTTRYLVYAEWFEGQVSRLPAMRSAFARATSDTRGTMKRVSKENVAEMAKRMAKTSYSSPGIVFKVAFEQLESYPNLIDAFVGCAEFFTEMSYDVLVWSLMNSLGKSRSRTQSEHALTTSKWLQALSRFSGKVFRKYLALDPTPVLLYVNNQLHKGNSTDLIILKEFISSMGGIVDTLDFTDQQILSMAGGERLCRATLIAAQDRRFGNIKSSERLIKALVDSKLAAQFLINLAQYRQAAIFQIPEDEAHIKYLSTIVDDSQQALIRYLDFLWSNLSPSAFDDFVPSIGELMTSFGLDPGLAFLIGRASLSHRMFPWSSKKNVKADAESQTAKEGDTDGDVDMGDTKGPNGSSATLEAATTDSQGQKSDDQSLVRTTLQPIVDSVQETMPPELWQTISPDLYVTFWALQLGDLFVPDKFYRQEKEKLKTQEITMSRDRTDMSRQAQERRMDARKELMQQQIELSEEMSEHQLRTSKWKFFLMKQFQAAFPEPRAKPETVADILLEQCFIPRVQLSPADAEFTFKYLKALHDWNAPGFKLMALYNRLFNANRLRTLIFTSTVREAENLGRFLKLILADLARWHKNDSASSEKDNKVSKDQPRPGAYDKEGKGTTEQPRYGFALTLDENGKPATFVEHAQFRDLLFGWHKNLNSALKACLAGTEWMHIRNAITVLKCVLDVFPAIDFMAKQFSAQLETIAKQEAASKSGAASGETQRVDLSVAAQGAMSELQRRKANWVLVQAFRTNTKAGPPAESDKASLRATAPEFKPGANKTSTTEEEDGEVQDRKETKGQADTPTRGSQPNRSTQPGASLPARPSVSGRDTPKRDSTPKGQPRAATPNLATGPNGSALGNSRMDSRPSNLPQRPPSGLPTRPDVSIPNHHDSRTSERRDGRETREERSRESRDSRDLKDRDTREPRDREKPRDPRDNWPRDSERSERPRDPREPRLPDGPRDANRTELGPRNSSRPHRNSQSFEANDRPAAPNAEHPEPAMNPERAARFAQESSDKPAGAQDRGRRPGSGDMVNSDRAAALNDTNDNTPTRGPREEVRSRVRGQSPRRGGRPEPSGPDAGYDDRYGRLPPPQPWGSGTRDPRDDMSSQGSHRNDRHPDRDAGRNMDFPARDTPTSRRTPQGPEPGPRTAYQDQNYGRLNAPMPALDTPSGPRGRGRNNARAVSGAQSTPSAPLGPESRPPAVDVSRGPPDERAPPTGPASGRSRRPLDPYPGPDTPVNTPTYPSGPGSSSGPGVHPDRRGLGQQMDNRHSPGPSHSQAPPNTHPDRMRRVASGQQGPGPNRQLPPQSGGYAGHDGHAHGRAGPHYSNTPDRGGRGMPPQSNTPTSNEFSTPTGPSTDRRPDQRQMDQRKMQTLNNVIQSSGSPADNGRNNNGNRNRQRIANSDAQVLTGGSPNVTPVQERADPMRADSTHRGPPDADDQGRGDHERSHRDRDGRSERSGRSRRSSRDRDSDKGPSGRDRDNKEPREHRDRRSGAGQDGRDREPRLPRDPMGPPPPTGGRDLMGGRDARHGDDRGGGRSGRNGPPREDRRDDRSRKRKSEEGLGPPPNDREKRPRR
ncbi:transcription factor/nuclear export subunit protein 2 domain-containing protein [Sarocladium implicatum]|nr:transcription factor/nuclear export subunit protein 2 domain-containing protein [Sarocladium implicatum]